jgi:hypothetical protein
VNSAQYERGHVPRCAVGQRPRPRRHETDNRLYWHEVWRWCIRKLTPVDHELLRSRPPGPHNTLRTVVLQVVSLRTVANGAMPLSPLRAVFNCLFVTEPFRLQRLRDRLAGAG